ncbi:MAG: hypothetical protein ACYDAO_04200 [Thermoplasmataceae archaeon]
MKGHIFDTPFYTKKDWHTGATILSRNGQTKGFGDPRSAKYARRTSFGKLAVDAFGTKGTVSVNGVRMGRINLKIASSPVAHETFGGAENKERDRQAKHAKAKQKFEGLVAGNFRSNYGMGDEFYEE